MLYTSSIASGRFCATAAPTDRKFASRQTTARVRDLVHIARECISAETPARVRLFRNPKRRDLPGSRAPVTAGAATELVQITRLSTDTAEPSVSVRAWHSCCAQ